MVGDQKMTTFRTHFMMLPERAFQRHPGGNILPQGSSKPQTAAAPDYTQLASASSHAADVGKELGDAQLAQNKEQFDQSMAVATPIIAAQTDMMKSAQAQGDDLYNYNKNTFRPIEQGLADEAQSGVSRYDTNPDVRAAVERNVSRAVSDQASAQASQQGQMQRSMESMGVNPNSGKFAAMQTGINLSNAAATAGAATNARDSAVALDYAKRMDVTGLGRNLPGASQGAYSVATNSGNSAVNNQTQPAAQYLQGMSAGNGTIMQGQGLNVSGLGTITGAQTSAYNQSMGAAAQAQAGIGSLVGMGLMAGATMYKSDRRLKRKISRVGEDRRGFGIYEFEYRDNPGSRFRGVMADEVELIVPEAVSYGEDGFAQVDYERLGLKMVEV